MSPETTRGRGNHGTIYGAKWVDGPYGWALDFDGVDDYVDIPDDPSLDITDAITLTMWVKYQSYDLADWESFFRKSGAYICLVKVADSTTMRTILRGLSTEALDLDKDADWFLGNWVHIALTYESGGDRIVYLNGREHKRDSPTGTIDTSAYNVAIGARSGGDEYVDAIINEPRIYDRTLTAEETKRHFESTKALYGV